MNTILLSGYKAPSFPIRQFRNYLRYLLSFFLLLSLATTVHAQSATLTTVKDMAMHTVPVTVPAKYASVFPAGKTLTTGSDYSVSVFYAGGLSKPRFMSMSPSGVLHLSDMGSGKVLALPDADHDGVADTMIVAASGFSGNHDIKFYKGSLYVTETTRIWKCSDLDGDGIYETKSIFISGIGGSETTGHITRTMVFDSVNAKVYVSVGSSCNVCRENHRAIIEQYNDDGTGRRVYASGTRNPVGLALHPVTNKLWANNNGSDNQGNETPPEWIDIVRDGGFYGHPFAYGSGVWFDFTAHADYTALLPITATDSARVATLVMPAALIRAHAAPMALQFLDEKFSPAMRYGFLTALRGSWNTTAPNSFRGFKVIYGHLSSATDTSVDYVSDFCSGFLTDTVARTYWGRPVGLATDTEGKVYVSSDEGNKFILVMTPRPGTGIKATENTTTATVYPNPFRSGFTLSLNLHTPAKVQAVILDVNGKEVARVLNQELASGTYQKNIDGLNLAAGNYFLRITSGEQTQVQKLVVQP